MTDLSQYLRFAERQLEYYRNIHSKRFFHNLDIDEFPIKLISNKGIIFTREEFLNTSDLSSQILITGLPGSGKTFLLLKIFEKFINQKDYLPVYVPLKAYTGESLNDMLSHFFYLQLDISNLLLDPTMKIIILFDGLDNLNIKFLNQFMNLLKNLWVKYPGISCIFTGRNKYDRLTESIPFDEQYEILPLDGVSRENLINVLVPEYKTFLFEYINKYPALDRITRSPLLLIIFLYLAEKKNIPFINSEISMSHLIDYIVQIYFDKWEDFMDPDISVSEYALILSSIAVNLTKCKTIELNELCISDTIKEWRYDLYGEKLTRIINKIKNLIFIENREDKCLFIDITFQDYFAGKYVIKNTSLVDESFISYWWEEALKFALELLTDNSKKQNLIQICFNLEIDKIVSHALIGNYGEQTKIFTRELIWNWIFINDIVKFEEKEYRITNIFSNHFLSEWEVKILLTYSRELENIIPIEETKKNKILSFKVFNFLLSDLNQSSFFDFNNIFRFLVSYTPKIDYEIDVWLKISHRLLLLYDQSENGYINILKYQIYEFFKIQYKEQSLKLNKNISPPKLIISSSKSFIGPEGILAVIISNTSFSLKFRENTFNKIKAEGLMTDIIYLQGVQNGFLPDYEIKHFKGKIYRERRRYLSKILQLYSTEECINFLNSFNFGFFYGEVAKSLYNNLSNKDKTKIVMSCFDLNKLHCLNLSKNILIEAEMIIDSQIAKRFHDIFRFLLDMNEKAEIQTYLCILIARLSKNKFYFTLNDLSKNNPIFFNLRLAFTFFLREEYYRLVAPRSWKEKFIEVIEHTEMDIYFFTFLIDLRKCNFEINNIDEYIIKFIKYLELEDYYKILASDLIFAYLTNPSSNKLIKEQENILSWVINNIFYSDKVEILRNFHDRNQKINIRISKNIHNYLQIRKNKHNTSINDNPANEMISIGTKLKFSKDYRKLIYNGQEYKLSQRKAEIFRIFHSDGFELSEKHIMVKLKTQKSRLKDSFRNHPLWNTLIVRSMRGIYRLNISSN